MDANWINAADRLPEEGTTVLWHSKQTDHTIGPLRTRDGRPAFEPEEWGQYVYVDESTHWMPLPAPPTMAEIAGE